MFFCPCYYLLIQSTSITTGDARKKQLWLSPQLRLGYLGLTLLFFWQCVGVLVLALCMSETSSQQYIDESYTLIFFLN